jgi:hypothetical protein
MTYGWSAAPATETTTGLGGSENGCDIAKVTSNIESAARIRIKRFLNILISFMVQQVIMFSETQVGHYYAHTVANRHSGLVALSATKSVTYS